MRMFGPDGDDLGRRDHPGVRPAAPPRRRLALALRPGDGGRAAQPDHLGDRAARRRRLPRHARPRPARALADDRAERVRRGLDGRPQRPQDAAGDRSADARTGVRSACCNPWRHANRSPSPHSPCSCSAQRPLHRRRRWRPRASRPSTATTRAGSVAAPAGTLYGARLGLSWGTHATQARRSRARPICPYSSEAPALHPRQAGRAFTIAGRAGVAQGRRHGVGRPRRRRSRRSRAVCASCPAREATRRRVWLAYPGGFYVARPACLPLVITIGAKRYRVARTARPRLPLSRGARCAPWRARRRGGQRGGQLRPPRAASSSCPRSCPGGSCAPRCRGRARPAPARSRAPRGDSQRELDQRPVRLGAGRGRSPPAPAG